MEATPSRTSWWKRHARRLLLAVVVVQAVAVAAFSGALLLGERTHATFVALYVPRQPLLAVVVLGAVGAALARRRVLLVVQAVLFLVVLVPVMGLHAALPRAATPAQPTLRLATYNVFFGKLGRSRLLDEIAAMPADVVLLQATYNSIGKGLRERFPDRTVRQDDELVIVSRFPILEVELPEPLPGDLKPMFVGYLLQTPEGPLRVYCIHPYSPRAALDGDRPWDTDVARREAQIAAVVAAAQRPGPPFVIAGDTNLPGLSAIARRYFADLQDAFDEAGSGLGYSFPAKRPWMRIDRVLGGRGVRFLDVRVGPQGASDHRPLFAVLQLVNAGVEPAPPPR